MNWAVNLSSSYVPTVTQYTHYRTVTGVVSADLPLMFMSMLGYRTAHIGMTAQAQRRDVNVVLVLDHSGSMQAAMPAMRTAATNFTNLFAGGRDKVGLVVFAGGAFVAYHPSVNFKSDSINISNQIAQLQSSGNTNTAQAIWKAYGEITNLNQPGALNVIVLFTDGLANTYTGDFTSLILPAAGCTGLANPLVGVIAAAGTGSNITGLSDPVAQSLNDPSGSRAAPNSAGCQWNSNTSIRHLAQLLSGLPATDAYGNSTTGNGTISAYVPGVNLTKAALANSAGQNVTGSGQNAFDDAANRIRSDANLTPLIYAIGLGGNPGAPPDNVLMARVANDPSSPSFNSNQGAGLYVYSPSTAQLRSAFLRIASEILRLAR